MQNIKTKQEAIEYVNTLIESCNQGYSRDWDTSQDEALEGFLDMKEVLLLLKKYIKK
jgi:hypothetical protein